LKIGVNKQENAVRAEALMKINDDHMYRGAALTQIAEHPRFTAINAFKFSRSAFKANDGIGIYIGAPDEKNKGIGKPFVIARNSFPKMLFE
jgi:hypothetical protein